MVRQSLGFLRLRPPDGRRRYLLHPRSVPRHGRGMHFAVQPHVVPSLGVDGLLHRHQDDPEDGRGAGGVRRVEPGGVQRGRHYPDREGNARGIEVEGGERPHGWRVSPPILRDPSGSLILFAIIDLYLLVGVGRRSTRSSELTLPRDEAPLRLRHGPGRARRRGLRPVRVRPAVRCRLRVTPQRDIRRGGGAAREGTETTILPTGR
mmetsp:Transcript_60024/g.177965  ORF Transcript_60024/g.177965 Transcript_60024/m.177965 type:complete len:206 (+) Transcript_60024:768-1385(+)